MSSFAPDALLPAGSNSPRRSRPSRRGDRGAEATDRHRGERRPRGRARKRARPRFGAFPKRNRQGARQASPPRARPAPREARHEATTTEGSPGRTARSPVAAPRSHAGAVTSSSPTAEVSPMQCRPWADERASGNCPASLAASAANARGRSVTRRRPMASPPIGGPPSLPPLPTRRSMATPPTTTGVGERAAGT